MLRMCFAGLPSLWDPAKKERDRTKGLSVPPERVISPSTVAMCWKKQEDMSFDSTVNWAPAPYLSAEYSFNVVEPPHTW